VINGAIIQSGYSDYNYIGVITIMIFIILFEIGMGGVMWLYNAEITNSKGITISTVLNWIGFVIVVYSYTLLRAYISTYCWFYIYAGANLLFGFFAWKFMIETKDLTPEQIEAILIKF
jgi:hypothetical protein